MLGKVIKCEQFTPQNNGNISDSITQCWTMQALECWNLCQDCSKCSVGRANYSFECQMPKVISVLLNTIGKPSSENMEFDEDIRESA